MQYAHRADYAALVDQAHLLMLFYDERLRHSLTKRVGTPNAEAVSEVLAYSDHLLARLPTERRDFDKAKAEMVARTKL